MSHNEPLRIAFFGTPTFATAVLDELDDGGFTPILIVTQEDKARGRHLEVVPTDAKLWGIEHGVDVITPKKLSLDDEELLVLSNSDWDVFVVASYGKILPQEILNIPKYGVLNIHPSLLPKLRGASPVRTAILTDQKDAVGVSVILLDAEMDHGPILAQARIEPEAWPIGADMLEDLLAHEGGKLLCEVLPLYLEGQITPESQNHDEATFSKKIEKQMGEVDLSQNPFENLRKIKALEGWPGAFFFIEKEGKPYRVKIIDAELGMDGQLRVLRVIPEGKKEMDYADFLRGVKKDSQE